MENKTSTEQTRETIKSSLLEFVVRASQKHATAAEISALPAVAQILLELEDKQ